MNEATRTGNIDITTEGRPASGWLDRTAAKLIRTQLSRMTDGHLTITDPWGRWHFGQPSTLGARVVIHATSVYRRVLAGGTLAAARAYRDGEWEADDPAAVCRIFGRNAHLIESFDEGWARISRPWNKLVRKLRGNSRTGSRRNIRAHYDLGNDLFGLFLDDTMNYSCGIFERPGMTMREASVAKMDRVCRTLELSASDHLVEIGTGWGGLAMHAAQHYGCRVTTATVSKAQHTLAVERVREAGLDDRITVLLCDYRDLSGEYDKLVSIEMIEAVGHEYLDAYFATCGRLLKPGGRMLVQAITVPDEHYDRHRRTVDFIQQDIFPGSCIPSIGAMREAMARTTDLEMVEIFDITPHYAETLRRWRAAFMSKLDEVRALGLPDDFIRMWEYYLAYTEAGFEERMTGDVQILFRHSDHDHHDHMEGRASARPAPGRPTPAPPSVRPGHRRLPMTERLLSLGLDLVERGFVPDRIVRRAIRGICKRRLREQAAAGPDAQAAFIRSLAESPIALVPEKANEQHYEAPVELFERALGPHLKYSCCYWDEATGTLDEAEARALAITCEHADLQDGQDVLELGCGWGSLTLWMAAHYPTSRILAVSNSRLQREFIVGRAARRGLTNVEVVTADMNDFSTDRRFDRVVSVEMFEHMRNYPLLFERVASWMRPDAKLFVHVFCHRQYAYPYETEGAGNWLGRHFFSGGLMPSASLLAEIASPLEATSQWEWDGTHYEKTANAWLANFDRARAELLPVFERAYGSSDAARWIQRWRVFFMACAELWGYAGGREWFVSHHLFEPRRTASARGTRAKGEAA